MTVPQVRIFASGQNWYFCKFPCRELGGEKIESDGVRGRVRFGRGNPVAKWAVLHG